jgi:hypothetical protein
VSLDGGNKNKDKGLLWGIRRISTKLKQCPNGLLMRSFYILSIRNQTKRDEHKNLPAV